MAMEYAMMQRFQAALTMPPAITIPMLQRIMVPATSALAVAKAQGRVLLTP